MIKQELEEGTNQASANYRIRQTQVWEDPVPMLGVAIADILSTILNLLRFGEEGGGATRVAKQREIHTWEAAKLMFAEQFSHLANAVSEYL